MVGEGDQPMEAQTQPTEATHVNSGSEQGNPQNESHGSNTDVWENDSNPYKKRYQETHKEKLKALNKKYYLAKKKKRGPTEREKRKKFGEQNPEVWKYQKESKRGGGGGGKKKNETKNSRQISGAEHSI